MSVRQMLSASLLGVFMGLVFLVIFITYMERVEASIPRGGSNLVDQLRVLPKESREKIANMYLVNSIAHAVGPESMDKCHEAILKAVTLNPCQPRAGDLQAKASLLMQSLIVNEVTAETKVEASALPVGKVAI